MQKSKNMDNLDKKIEELITIGVEEIIEKNSLVKKLKSGKTLRIKFGVDPTSPDLHLGHCVILRKLKQFQLLGHKVIFLIGDFTATIGDPSGRTVMRKSLAKKEILKNMKDYIKQAGKILDIKKTEIRYNSEWYEKRSAMFLFELSSRFTLARVTERDDFQRRLKENIDISMLEIIYPLLQGYDSVMLKSDIEIGGRDQKFNLLMGRKVQKKYNQPQQDIITMPLLEGTDGARKMSKSCGNYIGINEPFLEMFGKIMSIPDELMWKYFILLTDVSIEEIEKIQEQKQKTLISPKDVKILLAKKIIEIFHGKKEAENAEKEFEKVFKDNQAPSEIEEIKITEPKLNILDLLLKTKIAPSKSEAKRLILQKGIKIDGKTEEDWQKQIEIKKGMVIQAGKRKFAKII